MLPLKSGDPLRTGDVGFEPRLFGHRQSEVERAATTIGTFCPYSSLMREDDLFDQRESEPGASDLAVRAIVYAKKF